MMRLLFGFLLCCAPGLALAEGFALTDFSKVGVNARAYHGGIYDSVKEPSRIVVACVTCRSLASVSVELGRSDDGTEGRFRSGETTVEDMLQICRVRDPDCVLDRLDLGPAVGWVTEYRQQGFEGATAVLFLDGDLLTIRSLSGTRSRTNDNLDTALSQIAPQIIGK